MQSQHLEQHTLHKYRNFEMASENIIKLSKLRTISLFVLALCFDTCFAFNNEFQDYYNAKSDLKSSKFPHKTFLNSSTVSVDGLNHEYNNTSRIILQLDSNKSVASSVSVEIESVVNETDKTESVFEGVERFWPLSVESKNFFTKKSDPVEIESVVNESNKKFEGFERFLTPNVKSKDFSSRDSSTVEDKSVVNESNEKFEGFERFLTPNVKSKDFSFRDSSTVEDKSVVNEKNEEFEGFERFLTPNVKSKDFSSRNSNTVEDISVVKDIEVEIQTFERVKRSLNEIFANKTIPNDALMFLGLTNSPNLVSDDLKTTDGFSVSSGSLSNLVNEFDTNQSEWNFNHYFDNISSLERFRSNDILDMGFTTENMLFLSENLTDDCRNEMEFCNLTREEYEIMLLEFIYPKPFEWVLIGTHAIVFFIGLVGNALVCIAVYRNHSMRTVTNYFIVNLAVADFMVILICLPPTVLWDVTKTWFFGTALCRLTLYFQSVSVTVSVLTLTFISMDRWYAICFPLKFKSTTGRAKTAILIIWLISLLFNLPELVVLEAQRNKYVRFDSWYLAQCAPTWSKDSDLKWHIAKALFLYTFPLLLMMIAYCQIVRVLWRSDNIPGHTEQQSHSTGNNLRCGSSSNRRNTMSIHTNASTEGQLRSRRKAAKMLVAVVVMFAVCYFPVHLLSVMRYLFAVQQSDVVTFISLLSHVMCYANSAVNPLIYNFMSGKFRREFHRTFFKCHCCGGNALDRNGTSFAPIGSSRTGTMRTIVRRNDSCMSYRLTRLSPSDTNGFQNSTRNTTSSFIENNNSSLNGRKNPVVSRLGEFAPDKELTQTFPNRFSPLPTADPDVNIGKD